MKPFSDKMFPSRVIYIKVDNEFISFFKQSDVRYFNERQEYLLQNDIEQDDEEQTEPSTMYWIPTDEWIRDLTERLDRGDNWHTHMKEKSWFSDKMENYINEETEKFK